jgi:hypothetical protein
MKLTQRVPLSDGSVLANLPDGFSYNYEEDETLTVWLDEAPEALTLRISCITVVPKDEAVPPMNERTAEEAMERHLTPIHAGDKSYFVSDETSSEDGQTTWSRFWQVGFLRHCLIISLCTLEEARDSQWVKRVCELMHPIIEAVEKRAMHSELTESEVYQLNEQREVVQQLLRERYNVFSLPAIRADLPILQTILDDHAFSPEQEYEWSCVGVVFGDIVAAELGLHWCAYSDEQGVEPGLRLAETTVTVFPRSMILKRIERGDEMDLDTFIDDLAQSIEDLQNESASER